METIKIYTNYRINGYYSYFGLTKIKNDLNIESDVSEYTLPKGYQTVVLSDGSPAIKCPDGEVITKFTDRQDRPVFKTHDEKYIALKLAKTYFRVRYQNLGADEPGIAWFKTREAAQNFYNSRDYVDDPVAVTVTDPRRQADIESVCDD
jgi:hypothetical protein